MPRTLLQRIAAPTARKDSILGLSIVRWDSSLSFRITENKKARHIERSEISHDFSEKYMRRQFFGGILHYRSE